MNKQAFVSHKTNRCIAAFAVFMLCVIFPPIAQGSAKRIAVLPLTINAKEDLSFLKDGIPSVLVSRLCWKSNMTIVGREKILNIVDMYPHPIAEKELHNIGGKLKVDYLFSGSLTVLDNRIRLEIKVADIQDNSPVQSFAKDSLGMNDLISQINALADEINLKVFGRISVKNEKNKKMPDHADPIYTHPEKLFLDNAADPGS